MSHSTVGPDAAAAVAGMGAVSVANVMAYSSLMGVTASLLGVNVGAVGGSVAAELPSGAAALVLLTDAALIATSICNPVDFYAEAVRWAEIADYCISWTGVDDAVRAFGAAWKGDSAEAFVEYVTETLSKVFVDLKTLADAEWMLMIAVIATVIVALLTVAIPTLGLLVVALYLLGLAPATLGASLAAQWPATGAWAGILGGGIATVAGAMVGNLKLANDVEQAASALSTRVNGATKNLDNDRIQPPAEALPPIRPDIAALDEMDGLFMPKGM